MQLSILCTGSHDTHTHDCWLVRDTFQGSQDFELATRQSSQEFELASICILACAAYPRIASMSTAAPEGAEAEAEACASPASNTYSPPAITLALSPMFAFCASHSTPNINVLTLVTLTYRVHSDAVYSGTLKHVEANSSITLSVLEEAVHLVERPASHSSGTHSPPGTTRTLLPRSRLCHREHPDLIS